jgi:predicted Holliday junction resolvase-like endonuclease
MLLADATVTAPQIGTWVLIAILIINGLGAVGGLVAIFATRREVEAIEKRVTASEVQREEDLQIGSDRRAKIYAELKSQREDMNKMVEKIYDRIDENQKASSREMRNLPGEIIATLRNTNVIK